jgi:hypothetical protein
VTAYAAAPLCGGARRAARERADVSVRVRVVCLASSRGGARLDLAAIGADARRATEDSTAIGYLEGHEPAAARFTHPILESAGIAWIQSRSGGAAMARLLRAVGAAGAGSLRQSVRESLASPRAGRAAPRRGRGA